MICGKVAFENLEQRVSCNTYLRYATRRLPTNNKFVDHFTDDMLVKLDRLPALTLKNHSRMWLTI